MISGEPLFAAKTEFQLGMLIMKMQRISFRQGLSKQAQDLLTGLFRKTQKSGSNGRPFPSIRG